MTRVSKQEVARETLSAQKTEAAQNSEMLCFSPTLICIIDVLTVELLINTEDKLGSCTEA